MAKLPQRQRVRQHGETNTEFHVASAKLNEIARSFGIVDRVLSDPVEGVDVVHVPGAPPGWTDGVTVTLNSASLPKMQAVNDPKDLAIWLGANAHEIGHTLFSPRWNDRFMRAAKRKEEVGYRGTLNVLNLIEDQRQERMLLARFRPWRSYLLAMIAHSMIAEPLENGSARDLGDLWPWLVGRTWMPAEMRKQSRDLYPGDADQLARLVGRFQQLTDLDGEDMDEALVILSDVYENLYAAGVWDFANQPPTGCGASTDGEQANRFQPDDTPDWEDVDDDDDDLPAAGSDTDDDRLDDADDLFGSHDPDDEDDTDDEGGNPGDGDGSDGDGDEDDDGDDGNLGSGDSNTDGSDSESLSGGEGGGDSGSGVDRPGKREQAPTGADLKDALQEVIYDAMADAMAESNDVQEEISRLKSALDDEQEHNLSLPRFNGDSRNVPINGEVFAQAYQLEREFSKLVDAAEPGWHRNTDNGRLNVDRLLEELHSTSPDFDTIFDEWKPGAMEETSLDVTILLDISGSMGGSARIPGGRYFNGGLIQPAIEATWQIRRAVEKVNGTVQVITFDTKCELLVDKDAKAHPEVVERPTPRGGTEPTSAIEECWKRLRTVKDVAHKIVVIISDGGWGGGYVDVTDLDRSVGWGEFSDPNVYYKAGEYVLAMREEGVTVLGIMLDTQVDYLPEHMPKAEAEAHLDAVRQRDRQYLRMQGVDPELSRVYADPTDLVPQFRDVVTKLMAEAMQTEGVFV